MKKVFITGMFRSGTTFLARMLNVHSKVICASDPIRPLLNSLRYDIASKDYQEKNERFIPLDDYFIENSELLNEILKSNFNHTVTEEHSKLINTLISSAQPYSKLWSDSFDKNINFNTYKELLDYSLSLIDKTYRKKDENIIAFKEVWTNEFVPAFLNSYKDSKSIILLRDPRAIIASNIASGERYPLFFLTRQWRKLAYLTKILKDKYPNNILVLRYEDLISKPEENIHKISNFLDIEFENSLLDISNYKDGSGNQWKKNTHYKDDKNTTKIDASNINKWKSKLTQEELKMVELVCSDWMEKYNYETFFDKKSLIENNNFPIYETNSLANWIRKFSFDEDEIKFNKEILIEKMRLLTLDNKEIISENEKKLLHII